MKFARLARRSADLVGSPAAFGVAVAAILLWAVAGPMFDFSETWQLIVNTGTTISTFLMVFLLQHSQNHDTKAMHQKLDELIQGLSGPRNTVAGIERKDEDD